MLDLDGVESALLDLGFMRIEGQNIAGAGAGGQPPVIVDAAHRLAVDFEQYVTALDLGIERRAHGLDARDDHALRAVRQPEARRKIAVDLAHRHPERRAALARWLGLLILCARGGASIARGAPG